MATPDDQLLRERNQLPFIRLDPAAHAEFREMLRHNPTLCASIRDYARVNNVHIKQRQGEAPSEFILPDYDALVPPPMDADDAERFDLSEAQASTLMEVLYANAAHAVRSDWKAKHPNQEFTMQGMQDEEMNLQEVFNQALGQEFHRGNREQYRRQTELLKANLHRAFDKKTFDARVKALETKMADEKKSDEEKEAENERKQREAARQRASQQQSPKNRPPPFGQVLQESGRWNLETAAWVAFFDTAFYPMFTLLFIVKNFREYAPDNWETLGVTLREIGRDMYNHYQETLGHGNTTYKNQAGGPGGHEDQIKAAQAQAAAQPPQPKPNNPGQS